MNSSVDHRDDEYPEDHSSLSKPRSYPGTAPRLSHLYQPPQTKICYFYKDDDVTCRRLKLAINKKYYNNVEILKGDLTKKVPGLPFGVRSIYTSHGRHSVGSVDDLEHDRHYVCSTYKKAKGVDISRVQQSKPSWHGGRVSSGRGAYSRSLREPPDIHSVETPRRTKHAWAPPRDTDSGPFPVRPKKITVIDQDRPTQRHIILLNRKTAQTFEQVLEDMSEMFQMPCKRLYTLDGRPIRSLSSVFNGPDCYFVTEGDHFKPNTSKSDPTPRRRRPGPHHGGVSDKLRVKRDRLNATQGEEVSASPDTDISLPSSAPPKTPEFQGGKWSVWVTTNELPSAGTRAEVSITVYGHKGNSGPIPLGYTDGQTFQAGQVDEFEITVGNIGEIYKIRVAHDNNGEFPGWFLDQVRMRDMHTTEELIFDCQRWLSRDEEDGEICRELPAVRDTEQILPIIIYEITTVTGDLWNAATSANVYITLYGERGDTGVRQLYKPTRENFKKGQTDVFTLEGVSLGQIKRAIIGHDGSKAGEGWNLEKMIIRAMEMGQSKQPIFWTFHCARWLDVGEGDGKIVRELKPNNLPSPEIIERKIFELEKWKYGPECVVMLFSKATQKSVRIKPDSSVDAMGEYNDVQGQLYVIPGKGPGPNRIFQSVANRKFHLAIDNGKIMGKGKGGTYCEFRLRAQDDRSIILESHKYINQQLTAQPSGRMGDPRAQSGDPTKQFVVYCKGMLRDQGTIVLCTSLSQTMRLNNDSGLYGTGNKDRLAHFTVHKVKDGCVRMFESTVFKGQYIRLKDGQVDCKGKGGPECEFKIEKIRDQGYVTIESGSNRGLYLGMTPDGRIRPVVNTGDKNVRFFPEVIRFGIEKSRVASPQSLSPIPLPNKPAKVQRQRKRTPTPPPPKTPTPEPARSPTPVFVTNDDQEEEESPDFVDGDWKVFITTEENNDGGDVTMVVYGDQGNSGPILLGKSTDSGLFAAGNIDEFKVNLLKIGKIYKIRLELHAPNVRKDPSWKVKEVKMKDMTTNETLKYKFNQWVSKNHGDGDTMRELGAIRPKQKVPKLYTYQVHVYTGSEEGSDTDANVYINLFGEFGDTGKRLLLRSDQNPKFEQSQLDKFELEAVDLGKLKRCVISHDGEGAGEGWFCEEVIVRETEEADKEWVFACHRWLDSSIEDNKIERVLKLKGDTARVREYRPIPAATKQAEEEETQRETEHKEEEKPKDGEWRMWIVTGREDNMATVNEVTLVAYGEDGISDPVTLGNGRDGTYFQKGNNDDFKIDLGKDLGKLYKIRIGHDDVEQESGWFLEKVKMKNLITEHILNFKPNRWLSRLEEDRDVWRELPVVWPGEDPLPVVIYTVEVYTGSKPGSDTEASLYIELYGKRGDSGRRVLYQSKNNDTKFQEGQVDIFSLEAVDLDDIEKVVIGHDEKGKGGGWFCDHVMVKCGDDADEVMYFFPCGKWLDKGQEDGKIERELKPAEPPKQSKGEYHLWVTTHQDSRPCNESGVVLVVYGDKGKSRDVELFVEDENLFEAGNVDEFEASLGDIGKPYKIRIGRHDKDKWEGWFLDEVKMVDKDTGDEYVFEFGRWMSRELDDFDIVRELPVKEKEKPLMPMTHYEVSVHTGDRWAADTDASVYVTLFGSKGDFGKRWMYATTENGPVDMFHRNQVNTFMFESVTLQDLKKLIIGHNGQGHGAGWFLDKVVVKETEGEHAGKEFTFPCNRWLDDQEDDKKTERELKVLGAKGKEVGNAGAKPKPVKKGTKTQGQWKVIVKTSDIHNAGTHANVFITAYGDKGNSGPKPLGQGGQDSDHFDKGKESEFKINVGDIGVISKMRLEQDGTGSFPDWHVEQLSMEDVHTGEEKKFYVNRWLSKEEEDGSLCREVAALPTIPVLHYYVAIYTANIKEAATTANVSVTLYGDQGDTGKRQLDESMLHSKKWAQAQVDVFSIEAVQLGSLKKITLEHDGEDKDTAWFVEKVIVKEGLAALTEFLFRVNDWIEPNDPRRKNDPTEIPLAVEQPYSPLSEEDEKLLQGDKPKSRGVWTIWTLTGEEQVESVEAKVSVVVCGTMASSKPIPLVRDRDDVNCTFETGAMDQFRGHVGDIGPIVKIRLLMDVSDDYPPELYIKRIKLKDNTTKEEFHFHYDNWLKKSQDIPVQKEVVLEMAAVRPDLPPLQELKYEVSINTGDEARADTEANMYCMLSGHWGDTGLRPLYKSDNDKMFLRAQNDIFEISAIDVGKMNKITLGHDGIGKGKGWLCDKVKVQTTPDLQTIFPCNRWFDTGLEDRKTERDLIPLAEVSVVPEEDDEKPASNGDFKVGIKMADANNDSAQNSNNNSNNSNNNMFDNNMFDYDMMNANNNNNGRQDDSESCLPTKGVITLTLYGEKGKSESFEVDPTLDDISIHAGNIGEVYKIRVCSGQEMGPQTTWSVQEISLQDPDTKEKLLFDFTPWLSEVGGDTSKELPAVRPNKDILQTVKYQVSVFTDKDSPKPAQKKADPKDKKGQGRGKNDARGRGRGGSGGRQNDQDKPEDEKPPESEVFVTLMGSRGDSGPRHCKINKDKSTKFQPDQTDVFMIDAVDLGEVDKIHVTKLPGVSWKLEKVIVKSGPFAPKEGVFDYNELFVERPLDDSEEDVEITLSTTQKSNTAVPLEDCPDLPQSKGNWKVKTVTGEDDKASTTAPVYIIMCGDKGETGPMSLRLPDAEEPQSSQTQRSNKKGKDRGRPQSPPEKLCFQSGQSDEFKIQVMEDIGEVTKIRLGFEDETDRPSWYVETVTCEDEDTHDEFTVEVHDWIAVQEDEDSFKEYPVVWPGVETLPLTKYHVEVYTGDHHKGGTNANVYILLTGKDGNSGKRKLQKSHNNSNKFEKGQMDQFEFECVYLGSLQTATVGHDGYGAGSGWLLDKVIVIQAPESENERTYPCECDRWLDEGEDDAAIERVLMFSDAPIQAKQGSKWSIQVKTGQDKKASPGNQIILVLYGDKGTSDEILLGDQDPRKSFRPGQLEEFEELVPQHLGDIYKVRIGYSEADQQEHPSMLLDKIHLQNLSSGAEYEFLYGDWVTASDTHDGWTELPLRQDHDDMLPVCSYTLETHTGDERNAGTNATVYVILHGERGDTGKRKLLKSDNRNKFEEGQIDTFALEAVDLGKIEKVIVGHDGTGRGSGWFLDEIIIRDLVDAELFQTFECKRWLDEGEDDGATEIELLPKIGNPWTITVTTVKQKNASPGTPVIVVLYGDKGKSEDIILGDEPSKTFFQPGETDTFNVKVPENVGTLYKMRVGYPEDIHKYKPFWYLSVIRAEDETNKKTYEFLYNEWVTVTDEEDGWAEIPVLEEDEDKILPVLTYNLEVQTGLIAKAGTDANVYLTLIGERGDTGTRKLLKSDRRNKFEQGEVDKFQLKAVHLGVLKQITIGHDGKGAGSGWFLDKISIPDPIDPDEATVFECNRWLDDGEDDFKLERDLFAKKGDQWNFTVTTGNDKNAAPGAQILIVMYGDQGKSEQLALGEDPWKCLLPRKTEQFEHTVPQTIGRLYKVRFGYADDDQEDQPAWQLDTMTIEDVSAGETYDLEYYGWVATTDKQDGWTEIPIKHKEVKQNIPVLKYTIEVHTSDKSNAGTNANVYIILHGTQGDTGKRKLVHSITGNKNKFEQGQLDTFELEAVDLLNVNKVTIGHDGKGPGSGWYLDKVVVISTVEDSQPWTFRCDDWLDEDVGDGTTERVLDISPGNRWKVLLTTVKQKNASPGSQVVIVLYGDKGRSDELPLGDDPKNCYKPGETEEYEIITSDIGELFKVRVGYPEECHKDKPFWYLDKIVLEDESGNKYEFWYNEWVAVKDDTDGWTEMSIQQHEDIMLPMRTYNVTFHTPKKRGAATKANVYVTLYGEHGDTGKRQMKKSNNKVKFKEGQVDNFELRAVDLGDINKVVVGHDGKGRGAGWYLDKTVIRSVEDDRTWNYPCDRWFDEGEDDNLIERELEQPKAKLWKAIVTTGTDEKASPGAPVLLVIYGEQDKSEEIMLGIDTSTDFQSGATDELPIAVPDTLGDIYKIRVGYGDEDQKDEPSWYFDKMILQEPDGERTYEFWCDDWVTTTDDQDGWKEIPLQENTDIMLPVHHYSIEVHTGQMPGSGTNANVYMLLYGERGDTGNRKLLKSDNSNKFENGQVDTFDMEAVDLGELTKLTIGHDGKGVGSGWFLDKVVVQLDGKDTVFDCNRWFDDGEDDGLLERDLILDKGHPWRAIVTTGNDKKASPKVPIVLVIYGEHDKTEEIIIGEDLKNHLKPGATDEFDITVDPAIGDIYKVRLGYREDDQDDQLSWLLEKMVLEDLTSKKEYLFEHHDWVAVTDDYEGYQEIAMQENTDIMLPMRTYKIEVYTGDQKKAGTNANVYMTMYGEHGDTGKRRLKKSNNRNKFEQGQCDLFEFQAIDLGEVEKVIVGHDGKGAGSGWFLNKIHVGDGASKDIVTIFKCGQWLDEGEEDGCIERTLEPVKDDATWKIWTVTGSEANAKENSAAEKNPKDKKSKKKSAKEKYVKSQPPSDQVLVTVYGTKGKSEPILLINDQEENFLEGNTDEFDASIPQNLGEIYKVRVGYGDDSTSNESWFLHTLILRCMKDNKEYTFELKDQLLQHDDLQGWKEIPVKPSTDDDDPSQQDNDTPPQQPLPVYMYEMDVHTGDVDNASTNANVYITVYGERGDTGKRRLLKSDNFNKFENNQKDKFEFPAVDLGEVKRIVIGHDGKGFGSGWYLDKVVIHNPVNEAKQWDIPCTRWLDEGEADGALEAEFKVDNVIEDGEWRVLVMTTNRAKCGTDSQVRLTVFGKNGDSGPLPLGSPDDGLFNSGATDEFDVVVDPDIVGEIWKIRLEHDNRYEGCGWHVEKLVMENKKTADCLEFPIDRWLDEDEDDGDIVREVAAEIPGEEPKPVTKYSVQTVTGKESGGGTDSKVYITLFGKDGDSGRRRLNISEDNKDKFEKGKIDKFSVEAIGLGPLTKVIIGHDQQGSGSGWYLDEVIVQETEDGPPITFPCNRWLDIDEDDKKTERELFVDGKEPEETPDDLDDI